MLETRIVQIFMKKNTQFHLSTQTNLFNCHAWNFKRYFFLRFFFLRTIDAKLSWMLEIFCRTYVLDEVLDSILLWRFVMDNVLIDLVQQNTVAKLWNFRKFQWSKNRKQQTKRPLLHTLNIKAILNANLKKKYRFGKKTLRSTTVFLAYFVSSFFTLTNSFVVLFNFYWFLFSFLSI